MGQTQSTDFPVTSANLQSTLGGTQNGFLVELNPTATALIYSTYLGGNGTEFAYAVAIDAIDDAYITGQTSSTNFPVTGDATQGNPPGGSTDAFVTVLDPVTNTLVFSTYLGGSGDEDQLSAGIALDSSNNIYVTGDTDSGNGSTTPFPTVNPFDGAWTAGGPCLNSNNLTVPCPDGFVTAFTAP